jgi:hypothetical protein
MKFRIGTRRTGANDLASHRVPTIHSFNSSTNQNQQSAEPMRTRSSVRDSVERK